MEHQTPKASIALNTIQDYLSIGYLYLLVLGIISDSIYYGMLGINILSYSTILDVLLSPIVKLTDNLLFPVVVLIVPALSFLYLKLMWKKNPEKIKTSSIFKFTQDPFYAFVLFSAWIILSAYIGYGIGGGTKIKAQLTNGTFKPNYHLYFKEQSPIAVKKIGNNSEYIFFIEEGSKTVSVSSIKSNLLKLELIR